MSTPFLLEVAPEIYTNPTSFYRGRGRRGSVRLFFFDCDYISFVTVVKTPLIHFSSYTTLSMPSWTTLRFFVRYITNAWGLRNLQTAENEVNLLLPLRTQKLKGFQLQGDLAPLTS